MENKVVVITGGSKGLGKSLAKGFISNGYIVVICAKNNEELEHTAKEIGATSFAADVTKVEDIKELIKFVAAHFGRIDIWVNNAGLWIPHATIEKMDIDRVRNMFDVNVFGTMNGSKAVLIQMRKQGAGTIVNIVSTSGLTGRATLAGYASSKWAVRGFTDSLREECKGSDVKVISVFPGGMQTEMFDEERPSDYDKFMSPETVAEKIVKNLEQENPQEELIIKRPA